MNDRDEGRTLVCAECATEDAEPLTCPCGSGLAPRWTERADPFGERIRCSSCGKSASTPVVPIGELVIRAWVECPECIEDRAVSGEREGVLNGSATPTTVTTESPGTDPSEDVGAVERLAAWLMEFKYDGDWTTHDYPGFEKESAQARYYAKEILARLRRTKPLAVMHVEEVTVCAYTGDPGCLDCVEGEHDGMSLGGTERFTHCSCGANDVYGPMEHAEDCPFRRTEAGR